MAPTNSEPLSSAENELLGTAENSESCDPMRPGERDPTMSHSTTDIERSKLKVGQIIKYTDKETGQTCWKNNHLSRKSHWEKQKVVQREIQ